MNILLVDDDQNFRRSMVIALEARSCQVLEAGDGMEALQMLGHSRVDAVIMDARMPGIDGFWMADQIKKENPGIKIMMLSAHAYPEDHSQHIMLTKPVNINVLLDQLKESLA